MLATDIFVDLFFVGDVVLNFNTGFIKEQVSNNFLTPQRETCCSSPIWSVVFFYFFCAVMQHVNIRLLERWDCMESNMTSHHRRLLPT